ncbi:hypothetical protein NIE88_18035 [Sporolactobacillus shoreicorticis]|uniref:YfhD family protein n=1 Tax=Sporolactobacillus shoreicorticis TaxID=1923877 RepID=A0ABW5S4I8_9BACL|nr:hypothetical protein [Sporolactobacillus shoreicorticis]MCO7127648.1 hypothetical protein [Sporolactobacillus shoreicorticis]
MSFKEEKSNKASKQFNEEFAEPLDEHSVEERERAQRTGDHADSNNHHEGHDHKNDQSRNNNR